MAYEQVITYSNAVAIPNTGSDLVFPDGANFLQARAFIIGTAGNLKIDTPGGQVGIIIPVVAGEIHIGATKVYAASTAVGFAIG